MIRTVWPTLAIMLLAAGIFSAPERRFGWRTSVLPPIAYRPARFAAGLCVAAPFQFVPFQSAPFRCAPVQNRFAAHINGMAATLLLAASYSRSPAPAGILLSLPGYLLGAGFGLLVATVLSTLASV